MKSSELKPGLFISFQFGEKESRYPRLIISVGGNSFRTRNLRSYSHGKVFEDQYSFNAVLYNDWESLPGPFLLDVLQVVPESEALAYMEEQARLCDEEAKKAQETIRENLALAAIYRQRASTILDEAHALAAA